MNELKKAKRKLYRLLLKKPDNELTGAEIGLRIYFARDEDTQTILTESIRKNDS